MDSDSRVSEKKQRLLQALDKGKSQVHLDTRRPGVIVPAEHRGGHHLVLDLSYRFDPPDLDVNDWGVRETLSFGGERFKVGVPWSAIYAIASHVTHELWMYPDDMPAELVAGAVDRTTGAPLPAGEPVEPGTPRAILREVLTRSGDAPASEPQEPSPPRRGHLRVVK